MDIESMKEKMAEIGWEFLDDTEQGISFIREDLVIVISDWEDVGEYLDTYS